MKIRSIAAYCVAAFFPFVSAAAQPPAFDGEKILSFGMKLASTVEWQDNLAVSPYSIYSALLMARAGAEKETLTELSAVLGVAPDESVSFHEIEQRFSASGGTEIAVANSIWASRKHPFTATYQAAVAALVNAKALSAEFESPESARGEINRWVTDHTGDRIIDLIPRGGVNAASAAVLVNAVYFKARWVNQFDPEMTSSGQFNRSDGKQTEVKMMHLNAQLPYTASGGWKAVELPYEGTVLKCFVLLPDAALPAQHLLSQLNVSIIGNLSDSLQAQKVALALPRFRIEFGRELSETLRVLGIRRSFTDDAQFPLMVKDKPLKISKVFHRSFIEVGEKGTEAAAATAVVMKETGARFEKENPPIPFVADHPFVYLLWDDELRTPLFIGIVGNPGA